MFANYRFAKPDLFWFVHFLSFPRFLRLAPSRRFDLGYPFEKYARGFTDRTGIISLGLTPLVWLLASRNSPLIWMTGVDYSTMQVYHRWVARMAYLNAFCHTLGYSVIEALFGYFFEEFSEAYWNWGWVAISGGTVMTLCSTRYLRQLSYETFLIGHIAGAVVWLVGCYYHVYLLDPHYSYLKYLYGAIAIWGFDRLSRWLMLAYYNLPAVGNAKNGERRKAIFAAEGYLVGEGNYLRLRLQPVRSWPERFGGPGTYVFLRSVDSSCWQSHPFTLAWPAGMPQPEPRGLSTPSTSGAGSTEKDPSFFKSDSGPVHAFDANAPASTEFELVLKSYAGYTKKLAKQLADSSAVEGEAHALKPVKLLVEGPYGHGTSLNAYDKVLLVAGGSGISATIAHLADLAKGAHFGELNVSEIQIVWAIRDTKAVDVLMPYLARLAPYFHANTRKFLHVHVFYTRETIAPNPSTGVEGIDEEGRELPTAGLDCIEQLCRHSLAFATIDVHAGRPVLSKHVRELLPRGEERTAVTACGPESLCDSTRLAVKGELGGKGGVDSDVLVYHEESFTW